MTIDTRSSDAVAVIEAYGRALQASDNDTILGLYAADAEIIPDQAPSLTGVAAIEAFYTETFASTRIAGPLTVVSAQTFDGVALIRCDETATVVALADGSRTHSYFRELFVLRDTPAGWRIHKYMFSQNPGQAATAAPRSAEADEADGREKATTPDDLFRLLLQRATAGDIDGVLALYEPGSTMYFNGTASVGFDALRSVYEAILAGNPELPASRNGAARIVGDLALTSTALPGALTAEVARRQPDGTWLWVIDEANILPEGWGPRRQN